MCDSFCHNKEMLDIACSYLLKLQDLVRMTTASCLSCTCTLQHYVLGNSCMFNYQPWLTTLVIIFECVLTSMVKDFHVILELSSPVLKSAVSKSYSPVNVGCVVLRILIMSQCYPTYLYTPFHYEIPTVIFVIFSTWLLIIITTQHK